MPKPLWTVGEMVKAVRGKSSLPPRTPVSGVSIDSRSLAPDEAFIALRGLQPRRTSASSRPRSRKARPAPLSSRTSRRRAAKSA